MAVIQASNGIGKYWMGFNALKCPPSGADPGGGGGPGVRTPKIHNEGKTVKRVHGKRCFLVLNSYPPPPFRNPVSAPALSLLSSFESYEDHREHGSM